MTAAVVHHPHAAEAAQRIRDRQRAEHAAQARNLAIERAKRIIDNPLGISDAKLATACAWYMTISKAEGGGGVHYLRADQHLTAIRLREAEASQAQETSVKVAMRYRPHMLRIALGVTAAVIFSIAFHYLTH